MDKPHILLICSRLDLPGGIERSVVNTANMLYTNSHQVTVLILDQTDKTFYRIEKGINIIQKNLNLGITSVGNKLSKKIDLFRDIQVLKKVIWSIKPNIIIGTEYQFSIASFFASHKFKTRTFAWEHHHFYWLKRSFFWQTLIRYVYPKLEGVICLNPTEKSLFESIGCKAFEIPNFVKRNAKSPETTTNTLLTIGWMIKRKGVDFIPEIAERLFQSNKNWVWKVIGTGEEEEDLRKAISIRNLDNYVKLIYPTTPNLENDYQKASIYVMTSRFECFPMVLLEAMSHGIPCVSFDCPTGPGFIIDDHENGILISPENVDDIVKALLALINNRCLRHKYGEAAYEKTLIWSPENVYHKWLSMFNKTML